MSPVRRKKISPSDKWLYVATMVAVLLAYFISGYRGRVRQFDGQSIRDRALEQVQPRNP